MLINLGEQLIKYNIEPKGIIHVGSHWAEEHQDYVTYGIPKMLYIEPCKEAFEIMTNKLSPFGFVSLFSDQYNVTFVRPKQFDHIYLFKGACGAEQSESVMYASNNNQGQSNSLLEPMLHLEQHPEVVFDEAELVKIYPLDFIMKGLSGGNILAMDCQGYEGEVLKGATETLKNIDCVYTEVNNGDTYRGNALIEEIDELLSDFTRVETYWPSPNWTWGDAIYIRKTLL